MKDPTVVKGILGLIVAAVIAAVALSSVEKITREQIATNRVLHANAILEEVLPQGAYNNQPSLDPLEAHNPELLGSSATLPVYFARQDGKLIARAITVMAPDAYVAPISLLVGIDNQDRVISVRVLEHRETPGLGDQIDIEKSNWIKQFDAESLGENHASDWAIKRNGGRFDQLSGATITSRAVVAAVRNALLFNDTLSTTKIPAD